MGKSENEIQKIGFYIYIYCFPPDQMWREGRKAPLLENTGTEQTVKPQIFEDIGRGLCQLDGH